jgi:hypothetical protein
MKLLILALAILFSAAGVRAETETSKGAKNDYQQFKADMNAKLDELDKKIADLKVRAKTKGEAAKENTAAELEADRTKLKNELDEMESSGKSNWKTLKSKLAKSLDSLNARTQKALNQ